MVGYAYGAPVPMLAAGALGAGVVALGLVWAWGLRYRLLRCVAAIAATGAVCGQAAQVLWDKFPAMNDNLEVFLLFVLWQAPVLLCIAMTVPGSAEPGARALSRQAA